MSDLREEILREIEKMSYTESGHSGMQEEIIFIEDIVDVCLARVEKDFYEQYPDVLNKEDSERFIRDLIKTDEKRAEKQHPSEFIAGTKKVSYDTGEDMEEAICAEKKYIDKLRVLRDKIKRTGFHSILYDCGNVKPELIISDPEGRLKKKDEPHFVVFEEIDRLFEEAGLE